MKSALLLSVLLLLSSNLKAVPTESVDGTYIAVLNPLNPDVAGYSSGSVTINIKEGQMFTNVRFNGEALATVHSQNVHESSFCPNDIADENLDGYIDVSESLPYTSNVLIPLDSDLNSQTEGLGLYPLTDDWGSYIYSQVSSFDSLMTDLYASDAVADDDLVKLIPNSPLKLEERVVIISGVQDTITLPSSIRSIPGLAPNQTLPIACGKFVKVNKIPGRPLYDEATVNSTPRPGESRPNRNTHRPGNSSTSASNNSGRTQRINQINPHSPLCRRGMTCLTRALKAQNM